MRKRITGDGNTLLIMVNLSLGDTSDLSEWIEDERWTVPVLLTELL